MADYQRSIKEGDEEKGVKDEDEEEEKEEEELWRRTRSSSTLIKQMCNDTRLKSLAVTLLKSVKLHF